MAEHHDDQQRRHHRRHRDGQQWPDDHDGHRRPEPQRTQRQRLPSHRRHRHDDAVRPRRWRLDCAVVIRTVAYGVLAYVFSILFTPAFYWLADLARPLPLTLGGH